MTTPRNQESDEVPAASPLAHRVAGHPAELASQFQGKIFRFSDLARCGDEIWIEHNGQLYRLKKTRLDKLILTK